MLSLIGANLILALSGPIDQSTGGQPLDCTQNAYSGAVRAMDIKHGYTPVIQDGHLRLAYNRRLPRTPCIDII